MRNLFVFSCIRREREEDRENLYLYFCLIMHARGFVFFFFERVTSSASQERGKQDRGTGKTRATLEPSGS